MALEFVKIAKIGNKTASKNITNNIKVLNDEFLYANDSFNLVIDVDILKLIKDVTNVPAFKLQTFHDGFDESLWLIFHPNLMECRNRSGRYLRATKNLVETFFIIEQEYLFGENDEVIIHNEEIIDSNADNTAENQNFINIENDDDADDGSDRSDDSDDLPVKIIDELYQQLRERHRENGPVSDYNAEFIQHNDLRPTLTNYQVDGVKWMLNREQNTDYFPTEFKEVNQRWPEPNSNVTFFYNERTIQLLVNKNDDVPIPTGGILADAMGLGKTVEMLDLILLNQRVPEENPIEMTIDDKVVATNEMTENYHCHNKHCHDDDDEPVLRCLCPKKGLLNTVRCIRCRKFQHRSCVSQHDAISTPDAKYICPSCWQNEKLLPAKTTFIISPPSIKLQWRDEVVKHIKDERFKVLVYNGLKSVIWINPMELASYDIILTDYATLQSEFYYSNYNSTSRTLRKPSRYLNVKTPLLFINWWRVCLDEAQMVSSVITKPARLVAQLSTVHRWVVTGTPIQKSIDDLYGLIYFLACSPYDEREKWISLVSEFNHNANVKPIVSVLQKIMWRTCKSKEIMDQVNIPEQTELIHYVDMTDLELFYYRKEHERCSKDFYRNSIKIGAKQKLAQLNPHMLKLVLEPLRKLRQDCSIPSVTERNLGAAKKNLKPDDLLKHLISKNEIEAKSELRSIAWCLNGIAALHLIKEQNIEAVKLYRSVLKWSKDYNEKISVDSLLQIHAIHNLLMVDTTIGDAERELFEADLNKLEQKYLEKYVNLVKNCQIEQIKWEEKIDVIYSKLVKDEYRWWMNALDEERGSDNLLRKIQDDIKTSYGTHNAQFRTIDGVLLLLTIWMDKVIEERENVQNVFKDLRFYIDNFKPITQIDVEHRGKMIEFLNQAYECHLKVNTQEDNEVDEQQPTKRRKTNGLCELCLAKQQLQMYESVIVDSITNVKIRENDGRHDVYSWKAPYQEAILKIISNHIRNIDIDAKEDGKTLLQLLDAFRNECKEYSQLWVEVNFTVSAYDELKMCKSRTQAVDPVELEDESVMESNLIISKYEVDANLEDLKTQMHEAELNFVRKLGQLKYLNHLEKNKDIEDCPICNTRPESKYAVLECGHSMCMKCLVEWKQSMRKSNLIFKCHICRHHQSKHNLYYVTLQNGEQLTDSSSKFESIVRKIKQLSKEDSMVKIVIFSQWSYILGILEEELISTNITFRSRLEKFYQTIKEFKDPNMNVTCLLLPLSYGSKGLNLIEATHVFFVEPILDTGEELQAIGRIHRIGQTKKTYVHRFIVRNTVEETIHNTISNDETGFWSSRKCTVEHLMELFRATDVKNDT